jgi:DNA-binding NarL/FixJ family response regulator
MNVVGAFAYAVSEDFYRWAASGLPSINLIAIGSSAQEVIELCKLHQPDVILVGPRFAPQISSVREYFTTRGLNQPLWIGAIVIKGDYPRQVMRENGVWAAIDMPNFTPASWVAAVARAGSTHAGEPEIRMVTAFPTAALNTTLAEALVPWPSFFVGMNCNSRDELSKAIRDEQPNLAAIGHKHIDDVDAVRRELRASGVPEPRWVLMLSHIDTSTLMSAAMAGIQHMITSDNFATAERLAERLHDCAHGNPSANSPLSKIVRQLNVANNDDDQNILRLVVSGATNAEIAEQVFLSEQTVKNRLSRMMKVASVSNRTEMALLFANAAIPTTLDR